MKQVTTTCHGQSEERTAPEQDNIDASLQGSSTSNPSGIVLFHRNSKTFSKPCQILTSTWAIWAIWQRYYNSLPGRAPMEQMSRPRITLPDDELPLPKKIRKDSEFCESGSVNIHANDDNHHSLDGEKKLCQRSHSSGKTRATKLLDVLTESLDNTDSVTDNVKPQFAHIANKH